MNNLGRIYILKIPDTKINYRNGLIARNVKTRCQLKELCTINFVNSESQSLISYGSLAAKSDSAFTSKS